MHTNTITLNGAEYHRNGAGEWVDARGICVDWRIADALDALELVNS